MKKKILPVSLVILGGIAAFFLARAESIIQQQQQALREMSDRMDRFERALALASRSPLANNLPNGNPARVALSTNFVHAPSGNSLRFASPNNYIVAPAPPASPQVPDGWVPFEFNGATYYRVPLALAQ